jgi:hypothetical protein
MNAILAWIEDREKTEPLLARYVETEREELREVPPPTYPELPPSLAARGDWSPLDRAAWEYVCRKLRRRQPEGKTDGGSRWWPSEEEAAPCCNEVRQPTRAWPWSLLKHCATARHVATRFGVPEADLKKRAQAFQKELEAAEQAWEEAYAPKEGDVCFKVMAVENGQYRSFHDDTTYQIGVTLTQEAKPDHKGGYYVFRTEWDAIEHYSSFASRERALLAVRVGPGPAVVYDYKGGKIAVSSLTPIEEVGREFRQPKKAAA